MSESSMITAYDVIEKMAHALDSWERATESVAMRMTDDAYDLFARYCRQSERKYYLLKKHIQLHGVFGVEWITSDEEGNVLSHIRQMNEDVPETGWIDLKGSHVDDLPAAWIGVGYEKTLEEVLEWARGLTCTD